MKNFLIGLLAGALAIALYCLKTMKPVINTDSYTETVEQSIKKLKGDKNELNWRQRRKIRRAEKKKSK